MTVALAVLVFAVLCWGHDDDDDDGTPHRELSPILRLAFQP